MSQVEPKGHEAKSNQSLTVVQLKVLRQSFIHLNDMGQRHSGKAIRTHEEALLFIIGRGDMERCLGYWKNMWHTLNLGEIF
ncbi:unnamed protein product [Brassica napus]|uniref:(rape) hypothetical protein n=1 Tax=Brassica napus TaxID=3708 RepID=A0A816WM74_BRANA|nr:unnamed protein product [Brassica napus]